MLRACHPDGGRFGSKSVNKHRQFVCRPPPQIGPGMDERLQHARFVHCAVIPTIFDLSEGRWDVCISSVLKKVTQYFDLRVGTGLEPTEEFERVKIAEQNRDVPLWLLKRMGKEQTSEEASTNMCGSKDTPPICRTWALFHFPLR
jgi:hypothetical protein